MDIVLLLVLALIPAAIAKSKGRDFGLWYIYGVLLFIVALVHSICLSGNVRCPKCQEWIKREATVCKHCGGVVCER